VDFFICETQSSIQEATHSLQAALPHGKAVWVSYNLDDDSLEEPVLRSGESLSAAMAAATDGGAEAVLFNCNQPEILAAAMPRAAELANGVEIGGYSNAFEPKQEGYAANEGVLAHRDDLDTAGYLQFVEGWISAGATIVGGCCGIMPAHIAAIRQHLDQG